MTEVEQQQLFKLLESLSDTSNHYKLLYVLENSPPGNVIPELADISVTDLPARFATFFDAESHRFTETRMDTLFPPLGGAKPTVYSGREDNPLAAVYGAFHGALIAKGYLYPYRRIRMLARLASADRAAPPGPVSVLRTLNDASAFVQVTVAHMGDFICIIPPVVRAEIVKTMPPPLTARLPPPPRGVTDDLRVFAQALTLPAVPDLSRAKEALFVASRASDPKELAAAINRPGPALDAASVQAMAVLDFYMTQAMPVGLSRRTTLMGRVHDGQNEAEELRIKALKLLRSVIGSADLDSTIRSQLYLHAVHFLTETLGFQAHVSATEAVRAALALAHVIEDAGITAIGRLARGKKAVYPWVVVDMLRGIEPADWLFDALGTRTLFLAVSAVIPLLSSCLSAFSGHLEEHLPSSVVDALHILAWAREESLCHQPHLLCLYTLDLLDQAPQARGTPTAGLRQRFITASAAWLEGAGPDKDDSAAGVRFVRNCWPQLAVCLEPLHSRPTDETRAATQTPQGLHGPGQGTRRRNRVRAAVEHENDIDDDDVFDRRLGSLPRALRETISLVHGRLIESVKAGLPSEVPDYPALADDIWRRTCGVIQGLSDTDCTPAMMAAAAECCAEMVYRELASG
ncbi:hypothetical protein J8273_7945 [Carpediemonas membranifera]|uniref:Uncharacterized protein n=1 Tax=Carpediemonas membranifera TaxID=201153 RepID=A0A8J6DXN3_9EUKA|nr:hypothetical protein J8273_7945 [Carpediemonas membranifera]|eukprot:KAG9390594.1 hypothetical protein J8273_7945 [Carpediemonas membranifera]